MAILDMRPVCALSGGEMLAQLDALHAEIACLQTRRLELIAAIDQIGYAKEIGATDTVQLLAFRHRLDAPAVRRDLKLAKALPKYGLVSAALPDPAAPTSTDGSIQYRDPADDATGQATDPWDATDVGKATDLGKAADRGVATSQSNAADHGQATEHGKATDLSMAADLGRATALEEAADRAEAAELEEVAELGIAADPREAAGRQQASHVDAAVVNGDGAGGAVSGGAATAGAGPTGGEGSTGGAATGGERPAGGAGGGGARRPVLLHPAQAEAIVSALEQVPARAMVPAEDLLAAETQLVEAARHLSPADLRRLGAKVRDLLDTDGPEPAEDAAAAREALWLKAAAKGVRFGGFLANENAELLRVLIEAGAGPKKTPDGAR
ncbi:MAG TPA: DUF222 domain-containing protein, partial [Kribbella sp.]